MATTEPPIIELVSLSTRHPKVEFLGEFGPKLILRLGTDPTQLSEGVLQRDVVVERLSPLTGDQWQTAPHTIGWHELATFTGEYCLRVRNTRGRDPITEDAACGLMGLLIHELEACVIQTVLQKGTGADYEVTCLRDGVQRIRVEVSGLREGTRSQAKERLREKTEQLLGHAEAGFVSVTTFQMSPGNHVHSFLQYVERSSEQKKKPKRGRKK